VVGPLVLAAVLLSGCASSYAARGLVLKVQPDQGTVTVSHEPIPGYMDAMVMPFTAAHPDDLKDVRPGDRIGFRIRVEKGHTLIDRVTLLSATAVDAGALVSPAKPVLVPIGEPVPDFELVDQRGEAVALSALRGKVVAVTFIYTRCPLPDYCPRMMANLDAARKRFADRLGRDLVLLTVSFDPKYDTPERLLTYAEHYRANVPGWHFLTGTPEQIARVCAAFGVEYWPDEGLITHTLQTAVVDREGRLAAAVEGKDYSARQLTDLIADVLGSSRAPSPEPRAPSPEPRAPSPD
jgi:protein SCO1/2